MTPRAYTQRVVAIVRQEVVGRVSRYMAEHKIPVAEVVGFEIDESDLTRLVMVMATRDGREHRFPFDVFPCGMEH